MCPVPAPPTWRATLLLAGVCAGALRQPPAAQPTPAKPLQAELVAPLDLSRVRIGYPVPVKVETAWSGAGCTLRPGSIVQGHVVGFTRRGKGVKNSQIQVVFNAADCDAHHEDAYRFTLAAIVGQEGSRSATGQSGVSEAQPLADAIGNAIGGAGGGLRSISTASAINSNFNLPQVRLPSHIEAGKVVGVHHTELVVGAGQEGATIILGVGRDIRLEQGTVLVLTHDGAAGAGASPGPATRPAPDAGFGRSYSASAPNDTREAAPPAARPVPEPLDETNLCTGECTTVAQEKDVQQTAAAGSVRLTGFGYSPRANRELLAFDAGESLIYLDDTTLLVTFDPHQLRERTGTAEEASRRVRVLLIDAHTHAIRRYLEWRVRGNDQYLWPVAGGRVLVHMGSELRMLDSQLHTLRSIHVDGKVAWVVSSPSGDHLAVGTMRERYSAAVKQELETVLLEEPEEDISIQVLDRDYRVILTAARSSRVAPPVLTDEGELRLHGDGHTHWKISELRWDRSEHAIATTKSACRPTLAAPEHDLVFAVGCTSSGGRWYRMLRPDGHPLLRGEAPSNEIQLGAAAAHNGTFAIRTVETVRAMSYGQPFKRTDLTQQRIALYRAANGASVATVATEDFSLSQMAFALSPSGDQLAVLGSSAISFYALKP